MYTDLILDYYQNRRNFGRIKKADLEASDFNPLCGDLVSIQVKLDSKKIKIEEAKFQADGCVISQASTSILTEQIIDKRLDEVANFKKDEFLKILGINFSPSRLKCALLSFYILKRILYDYQSAAEKKN